MERWRATLLSSSKEENTIAELYKLIMVWGPDSALKHLLTAHWQHPTVMAKHQPQHSTEYHTLLIRLLPLSPFKKQFFRFDYHSSTTLPVCRLHIFINQSLPHGFLDIRLPWMTLNTLLKRNYRRNYRGTHIWVLNTKNGWCSFDILWVEIQFFQVVLMGVMQSWGNLITWFSCDFLPERSSIKRNLYSYMNDMFMALFFLSSFWPSKPEDWRKQGKSKCRAH